MGLLAVHLLLYMGVQHRDSARRLVDVVDVRPYPLSAAGVNLVSMLCDLLGLTGRELPFSSTAHSIAPTPALFALPLCRVLMRTNRPLVPVSESTVQPVGELFCCLMELMDAMTVRLNISYLQFGEVIKALRERVASQEVLGVAAMIKRLYELEAQASAASTTTAAAVNGAGAAVTGDGRAVSPVSEEGESEDERVAREERQRAADHVQAVLDEEDAAQHKLSAAVMAHAHDAGEEGVEQMERLDTSTDEVHVNGEAAPAPTVITTETGTVPVLAVLTASAATPVDTADPAPTPKTVVFHEG